MKGRNIFLLPVLGIALVITSCHTGRRINKTAASLLSSPALVNAHTGIFIVDAANGNPVFAHQADKYFVPASNVKIATCYAAMKMLGDSIPALRYRIVNDSTVDISGTGDPSFLHPDFPSTRIVDFLKQFRNINWQQPLFDEALGKGWAWDDYQDGYMAQRSPLPMYGNVVRFSAGKNRTEALPRWFNGQVKMGSAAGPDGFQVSRDWDTNDFTILPGSSSHQDVPFNTNPGTMRELLADATGASVTLDPFSELEITGSSLLYSVPVDSLLRPMMHRSDNFYAEQMLMMLSGKMLNQFNIEQITDSLLRSDLKDLPQRPGWVDGSGLSRYNLFTPHDLVALLQKIIALPRGMERLRSIFPGGGEGTLKNYYLEETGPFYGKTGTLTGVVCISGLLRTTQGKTFFFSVLVNNSRSSATDVRREVEKFIRSVIRAY